MLKEEAVPAEEPNPTELSDEINSRGGALRTSPTDPLAFLYHYKTHMPDTGEYRFTHFDAWRLAIMDTILGKFDELQGRLTCPARSGRLDACFDCTDFMVVHCIMNNPVALNSDGVRTGLFDLCQQRVGTHVARVDRPQGGERMEAQSKTPNAHVTEVLSLLGKVEYEPRLMNAAMTAIFEMLSSPLVKRDEQQAQEACIKLVVILSGLIEAGAGKSLPRSVIYYRDVTSNNMPDDVRSKITKVGSAYKLCVGLYGEYRKMLIAWQKGQPEEPQPKETATATEAEAPAPAEEAQPEKKRRRTKKEMAAAEVAAAPVQEELRVTEDASVEAGQGEDVPTTHPIPPDEPAEEEEEEEEEGEEEAVAPPAEAETEVPAEEQDDSEAPADAPVQDSSDNLDVRISRIEAQLSNINNKIDTMTKNVATQLKKLEVIEPSFNALRKYVVESVQYLINQLNQMKGE